MLRCGGDIADFSRMPNDLRLKVSLDDDVKRKLVTQPEPYVWAPQWGLSVDLQGYRDYSHIFRLPNMGGWIQKWVYSRGAETELVPEDALDNSTTESTTIFRCLPNFRQAEPVLSTHWFLCPFKSWNGFTVGLAFLDVQMADLTTTAVAPEACGRFAMDETTGEVFMTSWRAAESLMVVAWTQTISSCERVRELFTFEAEPVDGAPPGRVLLRNSFYERRNCRICGDVVGSNLNPPCRAPARPRSVRKRRPDDLLPLQTMYRRFRGFFFGTCVKTRYHYTQRDDGVSTVVPSSVPVPIILDIRHGIASVSRRLRLNLRRRALSFGTDPRVGMLLRPGRLSVNDYPTDSSTGTSEESSRTSSGPVARRTPGEARRIRNSDAVLDRDSILHQRRVRNRESAARTNQARKMKLEANMRELEELKTRMPVLYAKMQQLQLENTQLKARAMQEALTAMEPPQTSMEPVPLLEPAQGPLDFVNPEDLYADDLFT